MKKLVYLVMMPLALLSCEDNRFDWRESKPDRVYLPKNGLQLEESYTIGKQAEAALWSYKSGYGDTDCRVTYMLDQEALDAYNEINGTAYEILPQSCYEIPTPVVEIPGKEEHGRFKVLYSPEKIVELCGGEYGVEKYVLPFRISSNLETTDRNSAILLFKVKEPLVGMLAGAVTELKFDYGAQESVMQSVKFGMDFESRWMCPYTLSTDAAELDRALADYNAVNGTRYALLPADAYALSATEGTIREGMSSVTVDVTVYPDKCASGLYAVPVVLSAVGEPLRLDQSARVCIVPVNCVGEYVDKTGWVLTVSSSNPNVGKAEYLIDGDLNTFWHPAGRKFSEAIPKDEHPWAMVDMGRRVRVSCFEVDPRKDQFYPQIFSDLRCYVSDDGKNFTQVGHLPVPWTKIEKCTVPVPPTECRYVKFSIEYQQNQISLAFAEFSIRGEVVGQ